MKAIACKFLVDKDHTAIIKLPEYIASGSYNAIIVVDEFKANGSPKNNFNDLLERTSGIWSKGDGLEY